MELNLGCALLVSFYQIIYAIFLRIEDIPVDSETLGYRVVERGQFRAETEERDETVGVIVI